MKKVLIALSLLCIVSASSYAASSNVHGLRLEAGYATTSLYSNNKTDIYLDGYNVGIGYDLNKIIGLSAHYTDLSLRKSEMKDVHVNSEKIKQYDATIDFGYMFTPFQQFYIKPYLSLGYAKSKLSAKGSIRKNSVSGSNNDHSLIAEYGVRMTINQRLSLTVARRGSSIDGGNEDGGTDIRTVIFNAGYQF